MSMDPGREWDEPGTGEIERGDTGVRILLTLLFAVVGSVLEAVLTVIVLFELLWTLVTRETPHDGLRDLANRIVSYYYRIGRYLTYNDARPPFPFAPFPDPLEGDGWDPSVSTGESIGLGRRHREDAAED